jgi:hypothetical protein
VFFVGCWRDAAAHINSVNPFQNEAFKHVGHRGKKSVAKRDQGSFGQVSFSRIARKVSSVSEEVVTICRDRLEEQIH